MAKGSKAPLKGNIEEVLGVVKEHEKHDWCKAIARIAWGDNPTTLDIRKMNLTQERFGAGISLTDEEADNLVDILVANDYGTVEAFESAIKRKRSRFTLDNDLIDDDKFDGLYIKLNVEGK